MHETTREDRDTIRQFRRLVELAERATQAPIPEGPADPERATEPVRACTGGDLGEIKARVAFGDVDGALRDLEALCQDSEAPEGPLLRASIERGRDNHAEASHAIEEAERRARRALARVHCERARLLVDQSMAQEAAEYFERAAESAPELADPLIGRGSLALHAGEPARAENFFREALEREKSARVLAGLGLSLIALGRAREAMDPLERALDLEADCAGALHGLVQAAFQTSDLYTAERRVAAFCELHAGNLDMWFTLAGIRQQLGDRSGAETALERIELFDPEYPGVADLRAKLV